MSIGNYDYAGLCEAFINQSQSCGKTAEGRMSFNRLSIYSYDSLLATFNPTKNVLLIYLDIAGYSNTSKSHTRHLLSFTANITTFWIKYEEPLEQMKSYHDSVNELILRYKRARKEYSKQATKDLAVSTVPLMKAYLAYMGLDKRTKAYKQSIILIDSAFNNLLENKLL